MFARKSTLFAAVIALSAMLPAYSHAYVDVRAAPPPPRTEAVPASREGYVWAPGYWRWSGHRHVWVAGHWVRERHGYHWVPARWARHEGHYRFVPGHWTRAHRRVARY
jgi:hypothetical protein